MAIPSVYCGCVSCAVPVWLVWNGESDLYHSSAERCPGVWHSPRQPPVFRTSYSQGARALYSLFSCHNVVIINFTARITTTQDRNNSEDQGQKCLRNIFSLQEPCSPAKVHFPTKERSCKKRRVAAEQHEEFAKTSLQVFAQIFDAAKFTTKRAVRAPPPHANP